MPTQNSLNQRQIPPWALLATLAAVVIALGYYGWRTFAGTEPSAGAPKKVYPGMYDIRAEAAKMRQKAPSGGDKDAP